MFLFITSLHENNFPQISEELLIKIANKDNKALEELYEQTHKSIYGFAFSILKDPTDAQDVMQDVFIKIYSSAHLYKKQGKPMAWILTITKNLARMKLRSATKSTPIDVSESESLFPQVEFTNQSDDKYMLQNALMQISEEERQIVVLFVVSGMKHREISEILNIPLSTVLSKYHRAIKKLKNIIGEDGEND